MNMPVTDFRVVEASEQNISEVERLMQQQAAHHAYEYDGKTDVILSALSPAAPVMKAFLVYAPENDNQAVCCVMYRSMWTFDGPRTYLEDICTDSSYRGGGIGKFAVAETARRSLTTGIDMITGAVAKNNTPTMAFWIKGGGRAIEKQGFGLTDLFNDRSALDGKTSYTATQVTAPDAVVPADLHAATVDPTAGVFVVTNSKGSPTALVLANAKFSAGSSHSPGMIVEPVKFLQPTNSKQKEAILKTALSAVHDFACKKGYTDHFYALAKIDCAASKSYLTSIGTGPRQESDDPESLLICMEMPIGHYKPKP